MNLRYYKVGTTESIIFGIKKDHLLLMVLNCYFETICRGLPDGRELQCTGL